MDKAKQWAQGIKDKAVDVLKNGGTDAEHEVQDKIAASSSSSSSAPATETFSSEGKSVTQKAEEAYQELKKPPPPANQGNLREGRGQHL